MYFGPEILYVYNLIKWMRLIRVQVQLRNVEENNIQIIKKINTSKCQQIFMISSYTISIILEQIDAIKTPRNIVSISYLICFTFMLWNANNQFNELFKDLNDRSYPVRFIKAYLIIYFLLVLQEIIQDMIEDFFESQIFNNNDLLFVLFEHGSNIILFLDV